MFSRTARHASLLITLLPGIGFAAEPAPVENAPAWQQVGWGGGSYYFATAWHPTNSQILYLASDCTGLYRSENQGQLWRFANQGLCDYGVYSLAVSPAAPDMLYALTEGGLCKSVDQGRHWEFLPESGAQKFDIRSSRSGSVRAVAIDPRNAEVVYAGSRTGKLFKTVDGGHAWRELDYRDALPKSPDAPAFHGAGALAMTYDSASGSMDSMGRVSKIVGQGKEAKDWSAYQQLTAQFRLPDSAPVLEGALVIQSGDGWLWQQGPWVPLKPGAWAEASLPLAGLKDLNAVHMVHLVVRSPQSAWQGELLVDALALHPSAKDQAEVLVADWEKSGDADGWAANRDAKDSLHVTASHQSQEKAKEGDVLSSVAVAPSEPATVYASNTKFGVFRSDDAGATWKSLSTPKKVLGVSVSAKDPGVVWAACATDGVYRSLDRGATWMAMNAGIAKDLTMREIALHPAKPELVYAIGNKGWSGSLLISNDSGKTWTQSKKVKTDLPGNPTNPEEAAEYPKGFSGLSAVTSIAVNPQNPDELYISGNWRNQFSADGGKTLIERSTGADNTCTTDIQFFGGKTYATAMDEGLLVSDNAGGEWRQLLPLKYDENLSGHMWRVRLAKHGDQTRIAVTSSPWKTSASRVYVSEDDGRSFTGSTPSADGLPNYVPDINCMWGRSYPRALAQDPQHPEILYLGLDGNAESDSKQGGGVFRSADGGKTWKRTAGQPGSRRMYYGVVVDPTDSKRIYWSACGEGGGVWRSNDEGATWEHVFKTESWIFNIDIAPSGTLLVGGKDLYRSTDHGATFQKVSTITGAGTIVGIAIDPADEQRLWISRTTWDSSSNGGVYRTVDGGTTWQEITSDLPFRKPQLLRYNAETHTLWAGGAGIFTLKQ